MQSIECLYTESSTATAPSAAAAGSGSAMLRQLSQTGDERGRSTATTFNLSRLFESAEVTRSSSSSAVWYSSSISLGRGQACAVQLDGEGISRQHAKLRLKLLRTGNGPNGSQEVWCQLQIKDGGSKNGTAITGLSDDSSVRQLKKTTWHILQGECCTNAVRCWGQQVLLASAGLPHCS